MRRLCLGIAIGMTLCAPPLFAYRMAKPPTFLTWNSNTFTQLNDVLLQLWNISNGRHTMDRVTADPDGTRPCSVGESVFFDTAVDQLCICAVESTKKWNCANLT